MNESCEGAGAPRPDAPDQTEQFEDGPTAKEIYPPIPANPRPGTRTIVATTAEYGRWRLSRVGLDVDDAIREEMDDYRHGMIGLSGAEAAAYADAYAADQPDVALWEGERCVALIRPLPGGDPEILRFDEPEPGEDHKPRPTTEAERHAWRLMKYMGAEKARDAMLATIHPPQAGAAPPPLTEDQKSVLFTMKGIGPRETFDRLMLMGPYQVIYEACQRLGSDAVGELRRMIGERNPEA
jgi:hypothetical protein